MQSIQVRTTQNVSIQYPLASVGDRILAYLIDRLILILYTVGLVVLFAQLKLSGMWVWILSIVAPWILYSLVFEIWMNGQTPGKRAMDIKVIRLNGAQASIGDYILRWMLSFIDF
jgi:uncharacterized RDD family membrane protein YckC